MASWVNYFVTSLNADGREGLCPADTLRAKIENHDGSEAFHSAFDLVDEELKLAEDTGQSGKNRFRYHAQTPETIKRFPKSSGQYEGTFQPALGYVWFDFDSHDGGLAALEDTRKFVEWLGAHDLFICYSGSKGFHVGVPFSCFDLKPSADVGTILNRLAASLKKTTYPTLDTTVFNAARKFRVLGSKHPKTSLYKIHVTRDGLHSWTLEQIKELAKERGNLTIPIAALRSPLEKLNALIAPAATKTPLGATDSISIDEYRRYRQPEGTEAFNQCGFLSWARDNASKINEPQWYACASIVGRFKDGRAKFQAMSKGHPDYSVHSTDEKLEQALQASGPRTCEAIDSLWSGCKSCPHYQKIKSPVVILEKDMIATEATGFYDLMKDNKGYIKKIPNYNDLLRRFEIDTPYKTIADMKTVYAFNGVHYEEKSPIELKAFAEDKFFPKPQEKFRQEFTHKVFANHVGFRSFFTKGIESKINFKNGVLDTETSQLVAHSPNYGFRNVLPYEFNPGAQAPLFAAWIKDVMLGDEALVKILQEFMGYVVRGGEYKYHKALWLSGSGRNGKSTFLSVLKALIGDSNYSTLSIKQISNDKFSSADLDGKIANFSEETSPEELQDSGSFKNLTGDGELLAQKKYGDPYKFRNRAKLIMTYNEVPQLKDLSPGMLSRPIIIPWKKDLTDESLQDRNLKAKLFAELPGIFNFAFEGWKRLENQEQFTKSDKSSIEMEEIRIASCTAASFIAENISFYALDSVATVKPKQLYEAYKLQVGQYAFAEQKFYKRINVIPNVAQRRRRVESGTEYIAMSFKRKSTGAVEF